MAPPRLSEQGYAARKCDGAIRALKVCFRARERTSAVKALPEGFYIYARPVGLPGQVNFWRMDVTYLTAPAGLLRSVLERAKYPRRARTW